MKRTISLLYLLCLVLAEPGPASGQNATAAKNARDFRTLFGSSPDEPLSKNWSLEQSALYLDKASMAWSRLHKCAACHTAYPYLMAGPSLREKPSPAQEQLRQFLEDRVSHWDSGKDRDKPGAATDLPTEGVTEVVATAATLAFHDAQTTGKLHPLTRQALERIWTLQQESGAWTWNKTGLAPLEFDDYFGAVFAALGVGCAPDGYAETPGSQQGLAKLRTYFQNNKPPNLHHQIWLLWASLKLDGLMTSAERAQTIKQVLALQRDDGGWNLPSLGDWKRRSGVPNDKQGPSDGYATGLSIYVLRQTGLPPIDPVIQRGLTWLKKNQRESGRWFTRSLNGDGTNLITNAGTALCAMALKACEEAKK
jgi:squalene-hopene/tetraprenyl-beta-curcumene cyclase